MSPSPIACEVELFDPATILPALGNRPVSPSDVEDLLPTMGDPGIGQRQPGIVYDNPERPGHLFCAAGNRRLLACRILGTPFKAIRIPGPVTALDIIKIRLTENVIRKAMSPREIAADIEEYIRLAKVTQAEAAAYFGFSPAKASKLLSLKNLIPELHPLVDGGSLCGDVARIIASLPPEQQKELAERAVKNDMKRDAVEKVAAAMRGSKRKVHVRDRKFRDGPACLTCPGDWTSQRIADWLAEAVKKFRRGGECLPASA